MKVTQMPPVHAANLVANSGNTTYGVDVIGLYGNIDVLAQDCNKSSLVNILSAMDRADTLY